MFKQFLNSKYDTNLKQLFGSQRNKDILVSFLNDMVTHNTRSMIKKVTYMNPFKSLGKTNLITVLCEDENGKHILIEIRTANNNGFENEVLENISKTYQKQINEGTIDELIVLAFIDFIKFPGQPHYKTENSILENLTLTYIEFPKFEKTINEVKTVEEKWIYFLKKGMKINSEDLQKLIGNDWVFQRASEEIRKDRWSNINYKSILSHNLEQSIRIGKNEERLEIARGMLSNGVSLDIISKCTGLSFKDISPLLSAISIKVKKSKV